MLRTLQRQQPERPTAAAGRNLSSWFGHSSAKAFVAASSYALEAQEQDLIVRVADAYLNILRT